MHRVLVADDQQDVLQAVRLLLKSEGFFAECVASPQELLSALEKRDFDLVLMDLNYTRDTTSGEEGLGLLENIVGNDGAPPVIVMTAWGSVELTVEAMRRGAKDFIQKPWDNARLLSIVRTQIQLSRAIRHGERLAAENRLLREGDSDAARLICESAAMQPVMELIHRVGPSDANVLITGENGSGKGVVARALHEVSPRSAGPMVTVNVGGLSDGVFESELFGHVKGAFTDAKSDRVGRFELAEAGTLFLDEIANVPLAQQRKLLRVLETGEYERVGSSKTSTADVRILSATNSQVSTEVDEGRFRQDLLFRLNTIEIRLPPLRERLEDIKPLASLFLRRHASHYRKPIDAFDPEALKLMKAYPWPGNIRELDHAVERSVLMATKSRIRVGDLGLGATHDGSIEGLTEMNLEEVERLLIHKALTRHNGNVSHAAKALGLSRSALYRRLERYRL